LRKESVGASYFMKDKTRFWKQKISEKQQQLTDFEQKIYALQEERKLKSNLLQKKIFEQYTFLNQFKQTKSLYAIFQEHGNILPPAGAGECAAPKLLQYCFSHDLKPICMAEFWWGASPVSEIRKHEQFYPACKGKCEPILKHVLEAIEMDENPMLQALEIREIPILYEDEYLLVINKPSELLSVPGKSNLPSVYSYFKARNPEWEEPIIVHRLDQSTSGIMVLAKDFKTYQHLQRQFIKRNVSKRYVAVLSKEIESLSGEINLPLRVDLDDRPRQMVCYDYGKPALTRYEVIQKANGLTCIYFYPHTGRTHQLRVHAAHVLGLNAPIVGDDLYGQKNERLLLHANQLVFRHPVTKEEITIECEAEFIFTK
ncbi:MAG TPA: RluA family pseudouridine synthase, partial [Crocinitomicaceae bacterium]|nr:RluA family pseudouridine synthase [Crocinitomicaceae bacterium]